MVMFNPSDLDMFAENIVQKRGALSGVHQQAAGGTMPETESGLRKIVAVNDTVTPAPAR